MILVDSAVALHACAKGRSPSRGLTLVSRKIAALSSLAFSQATTTSRLG